MADGCIVPSVPPGAAALPPVLWTVRPTLCSGTTSGLRVWFLGGGKRFMGVVCRSCGTENREKARFCVGCAAPLTPVPAPASPRRSRSGRSRREGSRNDSTARSSAGRWIGIGVVGAVALVSAIVWTLRPSVPSPATAMSPSLAGDASAAPTGALPAGHPSLQEATAAAEARLQASLERLAREDREREELHRQEREAAAKRLQSEQARRAASRVKDVPPPVAEAPAVAPPPPAPEPAPAPTPSPARPAPVATVEQRCADSSNFFSRSVCQSRVCADPALAQDPVCRRLREIEQSSRRDPNLLN